MYRLLLAVLTILGATALAPAQDKKVNVSAEVVPATAKPGDTVTLKATLTIDDGWHVYGRDEETGIPPSLTLSATGGLEKVGETVVPFGVPHETFGITSHWVMGTAVLEQRLKVPDGAAAGPIELKGRVDYMVCDEESCLPPDSDPFATTLTIEGGAAATQDPIPAPTLDQKVTAGARFEPATVAPGGEAELVVTLRILDGWHVYGSRETTGIPATVQIPEGAGVEAVGATISPEGELHESFGIESYWVKDEAVLRHEVKVPEDAAAGAIDVRAIVDYMACNDEMCDPPGQLDVTATLTVDADARAPPGGEAAAGPEVTEQDPFAVQDPLGLGGEQPRPEFRSRLEPEIARPGEVVDIVVSVTVPEGWHVYGKLDENPITLTATEAAGLTPHGENRLPDGRKHESGTLVNYWILGGFELRQAYRVPENAEPGAHEIELGVDYMLCDENRCLQPARHTFSLPLEVEAGAPRDVYDGSAIAAVEKPGPKGGWWKLIFAAIAAGLFALLMPCTYPMIPITISVFTKQAEARGGNVLPVSLVYGAGIVSIFVLIGVVVGPAIVPFATHWLTNVVIAAFFIVFAFSLFGWITLEPPRFLMNAAGRAQTHGGYVGVLLMGAALVVTSFTCTVPFVASLLALASQGGLPQVVVGMGVFGLTMAIPFVALSLVPGKIRGIPRAGNWMNTLKVYLGFIELAAAMKFISNVDLVINEGPVWLSRSTFLWAWAAIFAGAAIYLLRGFFVPSENAGLKRVAGTAVTVALAGYFSYGALGYNLDSVMTAIAPPRSEAETGAKHEIIKDDYEKAIAVAKAADKLVLVNFTGFT